MWSGRRSSKPVFDIAGCRSGSGRGRRGAVVGAVLLAGEVVPVAAAAAVLELSARATRRVERPARLRLRARTRVDLQIADVCQ